MAEYTCNDPFTRKLRDQGDIKIYLVGGAVRDALLNKPVKDKDWVVVGATPEQMKAAGFRAVGRDFPVYLHPKTQAEYALARTERKTGQGYKGFECLSHPTVSLEEDLQRRDFRINAIAQDDQGNLFDPFNGQRDLDQKIIRHVSTAFAEDPLRILRGARFSASLAQKGFTIASETRTLMKQMTQQGELNHLTPERVWLETEKALLTASPQVYFQVLRQIDALGPLFPNLNQLFKAQPLAQDNLGIRSLIQLKTAARLSPLPTIRFAALNARLNPAQLRTDYPRVPQAFQALAVKVQTHINTFAQLLYLKSDQIISLLEALDAFRKPNILQPFTLALETIILGDSEIEHHALPQTQLLHQALEVCKQVLPKTFIEQGLSGKMVGEAIRAERITRVQTLIDQTGQVIS